VLHALLDWAVAHGNGSLHAFPTGPGAWFQFDRWVDAEQARVSLGYLIGETLPPFHDNLNADEDRAGHEPLSVSHAEVRGVRVDVVAREWVPAVAR
jgi:hypothetical protein